MILGKLKEKQEISQERSVTMVPEPRNTNRSRWFPAKLRAITERKPTSTSLSFPIYDKLSFLLPLLPHAAFKPGISRDPTTQSRSQHSYILFSKCSDPDLNPGPIPSVTKWAFSFNFVTSKFGGFFQEN
jgi:hypothetical protein